MITKYKNLGTELSRKEMKKIKGGKAMTNFLWRCTDGDETFDLCTNIMPGGDPPQCGISCFYVEPCDGSWLCIF
jgi:hypothetical protein